MNPRNRIGRYFEDLWMEKVLTVRKPRSLFERMTAEDREKLKALIAAEVSAKVEAATKRLSGELERLRQNDATRAEAVQQLKASLRAAVAREVTRQVTSVETLAESVRDFIETQDQSRSDAMTHSDFEPEAEERCEPRFDWAHLCSVLWPFAVLALACVMVVISWIRFVAIVGELTSKRATYRPRVEIRKYVPIESRRVTIPDPKPPVNQLRGDASLL